MGALEEYLHHAEASRVGLHPLAAFAWCPPAMCIALRKMQALGCITHMGMKTSQASFVWNLIFLSFNNILFTFANLRIKIHKR